MRLPAGFGTDLGIPLQKPAANSAARIDEAARGLEANFAKLLISSMRSSSLGDDAMFPGAASQFRDLHDSQLAEQITRGRGLGLAPMIRRQLGGGEPLDVVAPQIRKWFPLDPAARPAMPLPAARPVSPPATQAASATVAPPLPSPGTFHPPAMYPQRSPATPAIASAAGAPAPAPADSAEAFVARLWPHAQRAASELGVCPKTLVAQAALETGWGRHTVHGADGASGNNLFGIKAGRSWTGESAAARTTEFVAGQPRAELARFRAYDDVAASFDDYVALIKNSERYASARDAGTDGRRFAQELQRAGYATDPRYADKIAAIAEGPTLRRALAALPVPRA